MWRTTLFYPFLTRGKDKKMCQLGKTEWFSGRPRILQVHVVRKRHINTVKIVSCALPGTVEDLSGSHHGIFKVQWHFKSKPKTKSGGLKPERRSSQNLSAEERGTGLCFVFFASFFFFSEENVGVSKVIFVWPSGFWGETITSESNLFIYIFKEKCPLFKCWIFLNIFQFEQKGFNITLPGSACVQQ